MKKPRCLGAVNYASMSRCVGSDGSGEFDAPALGSILGPVRPSLRRGTETRWSFVDPCEEGTKNPLGLHTSFRLSSAVDGAETT